MDNATHVSRKLKQIRDLLAEIESLTKDSKKKPELAPFYGIDSKMIIRSYGLPNDGTRWITCGDICGETGIEPSRANCSNLGRYLSSLAIPYRRSNGKSLWHMPAIIEKF